MFLKGTKMAFLKFHVKCELFWFPLVIIYISLYFPKPTFICTLLVKADHILKL